MEQEGRVIAMRTHLDGAAVKSRDRCADLVDQRIHLIGIGGSGMCGAASLLLDRGALVSGSDQTPFEGLGALVARRARVSVGHRAEQLTDDVQLVVISAAIPESNPELAAARSRGVPIVKYAELLGRLMRSYEQGVAIAGTHGKSTTTALCAHLYREAGLDPSFLVGANAVQLGGNSGVGSGRHFIAESCEYDRSFLHLSPTLAAILNIEPDHLDCYADLDEIVEAFTQFADRVDPSGVIVCNAENLWSVGATRTASATVETFGFVEHADWRAVNLRCDRGCFSFDISHLGEVVCTSRLTIAGQYNVANALAAAALAHHGGASWSAIAEALPGFAGVKRRLDWCGEGRGVTIIDDYAHHPTEIRVTLEAAKRRYAPKRTWVIFQPHQHARTRHFMDDFAGSFGLADEIIVPDIYGARETDDTTGSSDLVGRIVALGGRARYLSDFAAVADHVERNVAEGDLVLTMGAGDIWKVADELVARICGPH